MIRVVPGLLLLLTLAPIACTGEPDPTCTLIEDGYGDDGDDALSVEVVVDGLEVPWSVAFVDADTFFVSERPGRLRLVDDGALVSAPVAELDVRAEGEGGLLGVALSPEFATDRALFLYATFEGDSGAVNRVERWTVSEDLQSAERDRVIVDAIPGNTVHDGGRLRFGPDGNLYVATGDARRPEASQDPTSLAGKILRVTPDGDAPADNPFDGPAYVIGLRNPQGIDFMGDGRLVIADHGPSGEVNLWTGHDEINVASAGANLGWPEVHGCDATLALEAPRLSFAEALPPGGLAIVRGGAIPGWEGDLVVGALRARQLHRVTLADDDTVARQEVYLRGDPPDGWGRLRDVVLGPDGALYVTTSNCDGRGTCPDERDRVLRITGG